VAYRIEFSASAREDVRWLEAHERRALADAIEKTLRHEPATPSRNRKPLRPNSLASWELREGRLRLFYNIDAEVITVLVVAVGWKDNNRLIIRGQIFDL
jgi:mRNA-degrading endonuclease RelE of RelBE toxin-antitoxin system